jgi:hypothetical protein
MGQTESARARTANPAAALAEVSANNQHPQEQMNSNEADTYPAEEPCSARNDTNADNQTEMAKASAENDQPEEQLEQLQHSNAADASPAQQLCSAGKQAQADNQTEMAEASADNDQAQAQVQQLEHRNEVDTNPAEEPNSAGNGDADNQAESATTDNQITPDLSSSHDIQGNADTTPAPEQREYVRYSRKQLLALRSHNSDGRTGVAWFKELGILNLDPDDLHFAGHKARIALHGPPHGGLNGNPRPPPKRYERPYDFGTGG